MRTLRSGVGAEQHCVNPPAQGEGQEQAPLRALMRRCWKDPMALLASQPLDRATRAARLQQSQQSPQNLKKLKGRAHAPARLRSPPAQVANAKKRIAFHAIGARCEK